MNRGVAIVAAALAIVGAVWCYFNFERVPDRDFVGFSGEAARNPMLAYERLVQRMGVEAARGAELDRLPPRATLVLARNRHAIPSRRVKTLVDWVDGGGHLIVEAEPMQQRDPLLDALGVTRPQVPGRPRADNLQLPGSSRPLRADIPLIGLEYNGPGESFATPAGRARALLHIRRGRGSATVLSSFEFMHSDNIGEKDHGALAWGIVALRPDTTRVLFAPQSGTFSLFDWVIENALGALFALAALLALWLWRIGRRFGPVEPPREASRRRLLDHLRASGHFQWSAGSAPTLLSAAREACLAKIARTRPAIANLHPTARNARLAQLTQLPAEEIEQALDGEATNPRAFTAAVSTLQQIEEKLTHAVGA